MERLSLEAFVQAVFLILNRVALDLGAHCRAGENPSPLNQFDLTNYFLFNRFSLTG